MIINDGRSRNFHDDDDNDDGDGKWCCCCYCCCRWNVIHFLDMQLFTFVRLISGALRLRRLMSIDSSTNYHGRLRSRYQRKRKRAPNAVFHFQMNTTTNTQTINALQLCNFTNIYYILSKRRKPLPTAVHGQTAERCTRRTVLWRNCRATLARRNDFIKHFQRKFLVSFRFILPSAHSMHWFFVCLCFIWLIQWLLFY